MRLTTIGTGTVSPSGERVCAGHLVEAGAARILLDCGSGVVHRMAAAQVDWMGITHVAITHFHTDHFADLAFLIFAWRHGRLPARSTPAELLGPPGFRGLIERLTAAYGSWVLDPGFPVGVREVSPEETVVLAEDVRLSAHHVPHTEESLAYAITYHGKRIVYTGDTGPSEPLGRWAAGCDLLLAECSLPASMAMPIHLTPEQCGELAAAAGTRLLALTHFYPPVEQVDIRGIVGARYDGSVVLAHDGWATVIEDS